jgi:Tfp pilus assembly ATPase PilU
VIASLEADCVRDALERLLAAGAEQRTYSVSRQLGASLLLVAALRLLPRKDAPGRIPATEVLRVDADVASLVSQGDVEAIAGRETRPDESGAWTMDSFILKLHERGLVDAETARRHMINPAMLES